MKKILILSAIMLSLSSCMSDGIESTRTNNDDFKVTYLFEKDGIKVYRFWDGMEVHYFTSRGETMTRQGTSKHHHEENIE